MAEKKHDRNSGTSSALGQPIENLRILIVGGSEALEESSEILDSLLSVGYAVSLLGVLDWVTDFIKRHNGSDGQNPALEAFETLLQKDSPDLLIITSDDHYFRESLTRIVPGKTRVLDSFALKILQAHKRVSGQLYSTRNRLESVELMKEVLMAGSEVSILVVDEDLTVQEINNVLLTKTGMAREDCINRSCHWVMKHYMECCEKKGELCLAQEVFRTGRPVHTVREEIVAGNQIEYYTVSAYPLRETQKGHKGVLFVWKNITSGMTSVLDRQARSIRENFSHLLQHSKMLALGKLAAAAVHEINNPIQGILTFAKLMRNSLDGDSLSPKDMEKFRSYLDLIASESSRCGHILLNLMSFSKEGELKKTPVELRPLFDELFLLLHNRMDLQGITFMIQIRDLVPPIPGDRDQIRQALLNVLLNSIEAMPDGGTLEVDVDRHPDSNYVRIRVEDTGVGIPKELQESVFEPFFSTKADSKGVGLGLSVVYGIVAQHGGTIEFESEEGEGTTVVLMLPISEDKAREPES